MNLATTNSSLRVDRILERLTSEVADVQQIFPSLVLLAPPSTVQSILVV